MEKKIYNIIEVANVHEGKFENLIGLLSEYRGFNHGFGIKFQPFKYDQIALPDFPWYSVYQELYFTPEQWKEIIKKASETKEVWIDCFDEYTVEIVKGNLKLVKGLKFQASVLFNKVLLKKFSELDLSDKSIILNI